MGPRLAILAGLLAGVVVGGALLAAFLVAGPALAPAASASPPSAPPSPSASPSASASPSPSRSAVPSPSVGASAPPPSGSAIPTASDGSPATPAATALTSAFHIGEPAPPLKVAKLGGGEIELATLKGKPVWLVFMATWCPSCQDEFPLMNSFAVRYADAGLQVVAVDLREPEADVQAFADRLNVTFPMALDPDGAAAAAWGVVVPPVHFWLDSEGVVRDGALGGIGSDRMVVALRKVVPGVDVEP